MDGTANCRRAFPRAPPAPYGWLVMVGSSALTCSNLVELMAIGPRSSRCEREQLARLLPLIALGHLMN